MTVLQEYMALKRYISEKQLPARFQVVGGVGSWERPPPAPAGQRPYTDFIQPTAPANKQLVFWDNFFV